MAFIERAMHWGSDDGDTEPPDFETGDRFLAVHDIYAGVLEIIEGGITVAQFKSAINATVADEVDIDALVANAPSQAAARIIYAQRIHSVLILAESRWGGYDTSANVRGKLGI